jgi:hypothetical protein
VGALAHFLEREGLPTTQISLIREHTERIRPPRALWVPFELGRPFGVPGDAAFQTRVLRAALRLLEESRGPILVDYPEEAPASGDEAVPWACPIPLAAPAEGDLSLGEAFEKELARLLPWYALASERRGRTTVGLSGLEAPALGSFLRQVLEQNDPPNPKLDVPLGVVLKNAAEDLKALYGEAVTAQPGHPPSALEVQRWFWRETRAGELLRAIAKRLSGSQDPGLALAARLLIVPYSER